ncbi:hypothetical protein EcoM_02341 [Escherichia coli WV_060327]|nr:hypothetical protein EcoM_02341 [Escherichia coli WV_060327]
MMGALCLTLKDFLQPAAVRVFFVPLISDRHGECAGEGGKCDF